MFATCKLKGKSDCSYMKFVEYLAEGKLEITCCLLGTDLEF